MVSLLLLTPKNICVNWSFLLWSSDTKSSSVNPSLKNCNEGLLFLSIPKNTRKLATASLILEIKIPYVFPTLSTLKEFSP